MAKATSIVHPLPAADARGQVSDAELVARVLGGDLDAFAGILARHQNRVYSIAANFAANSDDASDLAQEVFLKAFRSLRSFRGQSAFSTWIYRIAINACVDYTRRRARASGAPPFGKFRPGPASDTPHAGWLPLTEDCVSAPRQRVLDPQREVERKELRSDLVRAISDLSLKLRVALVLHDVEGMTHTEIARVVGCSVGTTKSRLFRAREEMRRRLQQRAKENSQ